MVDNEENIEVPSEDIDAAQAVLVELQSATAKATEELEARKAKALKEERGLIDLDYSQKDSENAGAKKIIRVAMFFGYNGSGYHGMQVNPGVRTIEAEMHRALVEAQAIPTCAGTRNSKSSGKETVTDDFRSCKWGRAARTDKGVSAAGQVVAFNMTHRPDMAARLNAVLPDSILVYGFKRADSTFDARTCCSSRKYEYWLPEWAFDPDLIPAKPSWRPASYPSDAAVLPADAAAPDGEEIREITTRTGAHLRLRHGYELGSPPTNSKFTFDAECETRLNDVLGEFEGVHNFHNFTPGALAEQMSAQRMMLSVKCGGVHEFGDPANTKRWVRINIHGQSFLLNQIRKMVGMAMAVYRGVAPRNGIEIATDPQRNFGTPLAPELGLLLSECLYEAYNARRKNGLEDLNTDEWASRIQKFKQDRIYPMIKRTDELEGINYKFIVSLNEENFQFSRWSSAPIVNKSLKRPRSKEQKVGNAETLEVLYREEAIRRERLRAARKDELVKQGMELTQMHDLLRHEFPRPYLRGETDYRPKQQRTDGVATASAAGASRSPAAAAPAHAAPPAQDEGGATAGTATLPSASPSDANAAPTAAQAGAVQPAEQSAGGTSEAVPAAAAAVAGPSGAAADAPDAAVAQFIRAGVPAGAAEDDGDPEEGSDGGNEGSEDSALVARGFVARDGAEQVDNDNAVGVGPNLGDVGGSDDGESDGDADESEQEQVIHT